MNITGIKQIYKWADWAHVASVEQKGVVGGGDIKLQPLVQGVVQ